MNLKHLHYFWVVAHSGGIVRAAERLHLTPQTVSAQIQLLEEQLRTPLLARRGRRVEITDAGRLVQRYADEIFGLADELQQALRSAPQGAPRIELRVGVADAVPKSIAAHLLRPAMSWRDPVHVVCREAAVPALLAELALHRLDVVLADLPLAAQATPSSVKAYNHVLGRSPMSFFAAPGLKLPARRPWQRRLDGQPMLLPTRESALRARLEEWFGRHGVRPVVVGEFDDSALLKAFGREGRGVFAAPAVLEAEICEQHHVRVLGRAEDLAQEFHAITVQRRVTHPCISALMADARGSLFAASGGARATTPTPPRLPLCPPRHKAATSR